MDNAAKSERIFEKIIRFSQDYIKKQAEIK